MIVFLQSLFLTLYPNWYLLIFYIPSIVMEDPLFYNDAASYSNSLKRKTNTCFQRNKKDFCVLKVQKIQRKEETDSQSLVESISEGLSSIFKCNFHVQVYQKVHGILIIKGQIPWRKCNLGTSVNFSSGPSLHICHLSVEILGDHLKQWLRIQAKVHKSQALMQLALHYHRGVLSYSLLLCCFLRKRLFQSRHLNWPNDEICIWNCGKGINLHEWQHSSLYFCSISTQIYYLVTLPQAIIRLQPVLLDC